jgi:hypothetical protein
VDLLVALVEYLEAWGPDHLVDRHLVGLLVALDLDHLLEGLPEAWVLDRLVDLLVALVERLEALDLDHLLEGLPEALDRDHLVASQADSMVELVLILPKWLLLAKVCQAQVILPPMLVLLGPTNQLVLIRVLPLFLLLVQEQGAPPQPLLPPLLQVQVLVFPQQVILVLFLLQQQVNRVKGGDLLGRLLYHHLLHLVLLLELLTHPSSSCPGLILWGVLEWF